MIRIVLENVLLFLVPTALYLAYVFFAAEIANNGPGDRPASGTPAGPRDVLSDDKRLLPRPTFRSAMEDAPVVWLIVAGIGLVGVTMAIFGARQENSIDKPYEPAVYKDGRIIQPGKN